jgi:hypothetical protein
MRLKLFLASLATTIATAIGAPAPALAANNCVPAPTYWPTSGQVTTNNNAGQHTLSLTFTATQSQLNALACQGGYLRIDNVVQNAGVSGNQYALSTTGLGTTKEVPVVSSSFTPGVTFVAVSSLQAGKTYTMTTTWQGGTAVPTFTTDWIGSHWATSTFEKSLCQKGQAQGTVAWCVFQTGQDRHSLTGGNVALDGSTYTIR